MMHSRLTWLVRVINLGLYDESVRQHWVWPTTSQLSLGRVWDGIGRKSGRPGSERCSPRNNRGRVLAGPVIRSKKHGVLERRSLRCFCEISHENVAVCGASSLSRISTASAVFLGL